MANNMSEFNANVMDFISSRSAGGDKSLPSIPLQKGDRLSTPKEGVASLHLGSPEWRNSNKEYVKYSLLLTRKGKEIKIWLSLGQIFKFALPGLWEDKFVFSSREGAKGSENALFDEGLDLRKGEDILKNLEDGITLEGIFPSKDGKRKAYQWIK